MRWNPHYSTTLASALLLILESVNLIKTAERYDNAWNDFNKFHENFVDNFTDKLNCTML